MVDPPVVKIVRGTPNTASTLTFQLVAEYGKNPMPAGSINGIKTLTIIGAGQGEFGTWRYTRAGTFRYAASEVNTGIDGYAYDTAVYTITDEVVPIDGRLVVKRDVVGHMGEQVSSLTFVNTYTRGSGSSPSERPESGKPSWPGSGPKTGDLSRPLLWVGLIVMSGTLLVFIIFLACSSGRSSRGRRKRR